MAFSPRPPMSQAAPPSEGTQREDDLRVWMAQYGPALRRYFLRKAASGEADDLVQEVFIKLQGRGTTSDIGNVERYLFRTAASVLEELPPRSAQAFVLVRFEQMTQEEAAHRMGISVKAVEELMRRAFRLLRARVGTSL